MKNTTGTWPRKALSEIGKPVRDQARLANLTQYELWSVPSFVNNEPEVTLGSNVGSAKLRVQPKDVLVCKINPRINRVWQVREPRDNRSQIASTEWVVIRPSPSVAPEWLVHYLSGPEFREWIAEEVTGSTGSHTRAKAEEILQQTLPIPPLSEQQRIVGLLDEAFAGIATAKANTEKNLRNARALFESDREEVLMRGGDRKPTETDRLPEGKIKA